MLPTMPGDTPHSATLGTYMYICEYMYILYSLQKGIYTLYTEFVEVHNFNGLAISNILQKKGFTCNNSLCTILENSQA